MDRHWKVFATSTALWTLVGVLAIAGTVARHLDVLIWSGLVGMVACMVTTWLIATCIGSGVVEVIRGERLELERLAQIMATAAHQGDSGEDVPRIH